MSITSLLEFRVKPDAVDSAPTIVHDTLTATRAFAGCLGVDVVVDLEDPTHYMVIERWESLDADLAYREFRTTPEGRSDLGSILAGRPALTKFADHPAI